MDNNWCRWCGGLIANKDFMSCGVGDCGVLDVMELTNTQTFDGSLTITTSSGAQITSAGTITITDFSPAIGRLKGDQS